MFEELVDLYSIQGQTKESDFIQALLYGLMKHNLEPCQLVGTVTNGASSMIGTNNAIVSLLHKHTAQV